MKSIRNHIISKLFCLLMASHLFNCCVDMPDAQSDYIAEDLSFNDMESVVEIVLEQGIGIKDAIAEHDEPDDQSPCNVKTSLEFYFFYPCTKICSFKKEIEPLNITSLDEENFIKEFVNEIIPPPPRV